MVSNIPSTPISNPDGTLSAIVQEIQPLPSAGALLRLWIPVAHDAGGGFGRYFLVRCVEDSPESRANEWSIYARRVLFCAAMPIAAPEHTGSIWELHIPNTDDPGFRWLIGRSRNMPVNLLGPFGELFELASHTRTLLVLATPRTLPLTIPVVNAMLDRGGRVTMLIKGSAEQATPLLPLIPIPVEVRHIPNDEWLNHLAEPARWADQLCAALPNQEYAPLAHHIRTLRFQLDDSFAHVLVQSDILCGVGACLACVVSTRDGSYTRVCIHGPVLPLATIAH